MNTYELCLSIERDLEKYYNEQVEKNANRHLQRVFQVLADEEEDHLALLTEENDQVTAPIQDKDVVEESKKLFEDEGGIRTFRSEPSQLDAYRHMLALEEKTRDFYIKLAKEEENPNRKEIYEFLAKEEDKHCIILEEIVKLTERPEEWVESAEFGPREDY